MDALEFSGLRRTMTAAQDYVRELHERAAEGEATAAGQLADLTNRLMVNLACLAYCGPTGGNVEQARGCIEEMSRSFA